MDGGSIISLGNETGSKIYTIKPKWKELAFELAIIENRNAWFAEVTEAMITKLARERRKSKDDYYKHVKTHVTQPNGHVMVSVQDTHDGKRSEFSLILLAGINTVALFTCDIKKADFYACVNEMLMDMNSENIQLTQSLQEIEREKEAALDEKRRCEEKLNEFIEMKDNWEREMYSSFLKILNEKKQRISYLTDLLKSKSPDFDDTASTSNVSVNGSVQSKESKASNAKEKNITVSDSESDEDDTSYSTDDERTKSSDAEKMPDARPGSSKGNVDVFNSDSREDLGIFDSDSAPILPKRVKVSSSKDATLLTGKSTNGGKKNNNVEVKRTEEENTLSVDFSTQDYIDRM